MKNAPTKNKKQERNKERVFFVSDIFFRGKCLQTRCFEEHSVVRCAKEQLVRSLCSFYAVLATICCGQSEHLTGEEH